VWSRTQDPKLLDILAQGFVTDMITHTSSFGKSFAQATRWAPPVMDCLDRARERTPSVMEAMTGSLLDLEIARLAKVPPLTEMRLRDPELKVIYLRNETGDAFKLTAVRTPHGARTKEAPSGTIALFAPNNLKMKEESYDTDNARTISWELPSSPKWVYRLEIKDDMRAIWDVKTTLPKIVIAMRPIGSIGGFGGPAAKRCFFFVPQGTRQFKVGFSSGHTGSYLCAVQAPDGAVAGAAAFEKTSLPSAGSTWIAVQPKAELTAKAWSFIASGRGDISVKFEGIPPYYALSPDSLFSPGE
jgi:hypothetical protein